METVLITGRGAHISKKQKIISVVRKQSSPRHPHKTTISPIDLDLLILSGELSITSAALRLLASHDVGVVIMDG